MTSILEGLQPYLQGGIAPPPPVDEEKERVEAKKATSPFLASLDPYRPEQIAETEEAERLAREQAARERLAGMQAGGDAQWQAIQSAPEDPSLLERAGGVVGQLGAAIGEEFAGQGEDIRNVAKAGIRMLEGVGNVARGAGEAAGVALQTGGETPPQPAGMAGLSTPGIAVPFRDEANAPAGEVPEVLQQIGQLVRDVAGHGAAGEMANVESPAFAREQGYIPEDFWEGMKRDPIRTLTINGIENLGPMAAMMGAAFVAGPAGGLSAAYAAEAGGAFNEAKEAGASDEQAAQAAGVTAAANVVLEYLPAGRALNRLARSVPKREVLQFIREVATQAAAEGVTESLQETNNILVSMATYAKDHDLGWEDIKRVGAAGMIGAVLGGPVGGVVAGSQKAEERADAPQLDVSSIDLTPEQEAEAQGTTPLTTKEDSDVRLRQQQAQRQPQQQPEGQQEPARQRGPRQDAQPDGGLRPGARRVDDGQLDGREGLDATPPPAASSPPSPEGGGVVVPLVPKPRGPQATDPDILDLAAKSQAIGASPEATERPTPVIADETPEDDAGTMRTLVARDEAGEWLGTLEYFPEEDGFRVNLIKTGRKGSGVARELYRQARREAGPYRGAAAMTTEGEGFLSRLRETDPEIFEEEAAPAEPLVPKARNRPAEEAPSPRPQEAAPAPEATLARPEPQEERQRATQPQEPAPQRQPVTEASPADLVIEPERFQYKLNRDAVGATGSLAGVEQWDPNLAGVVSVWRDPGDGTLRVVNGHNRVAKARQLGVESLRVMEIDAASAQEARAIGAMQNIAEGQGTPVDAAKFFRDSNISEGDSIVRRLPMSKATVDQGLGLAGLSDFLFGQVVNGDLAPQRGSIIGRHLAGKGDLQAQLYKEVAKREARRQRVTNEMVEDIARRMESSGTVTEDTGQSSLFGDGDSTTERSLAFEEAEIAADIRSRLRTAKSAFGNAARNAPLLNEAGNEINAEVSRGLSEQAAVNLAVFEKLRNTTAVGGIISQSARDLASGKESTDAIRKRAFDQVRAAVAEALGNREVQSVQGVPEAGGRRGGADRAADAEPAAEPAEVEDEDQGALFGGVAGTADIGGYAPARPSATRPRALPLSLPELVEVAESLGKGRLPRVKKALRTAKGAAAGVFAAPPGEPESAGIGLRADLMQSPAEAARVLAHEIGHWIDYLPQANIKRGNILGSIASLKRYMKLHLDAVPRLTSRVLSAKNRARIRREAKAAGTDPDAAIADEIAARDLVGRDELMEELKALSRKWKPIPANASPEYVKYRDNPRELYADALSVLLNDPAMLEEEAPLFVRSFFAYLNAKPEVAKVYLDIQARIANGEAARLDAVDDRVANMIAQGGILRAQELLGRQENATASEVATHAAHALVDGLIDRHAPIQRRVKAARKSGKALSPQANPLYWLEEMAYLNSEAAAYLDRFQQEILYPLRSIGVKDDELGQLLFLRRVLGERSNLWNPLGVDTKVAPELVERLEKKWGREKADLVTAALNQWWRLRQPLIEKLIASGAVTPETAEKMRTNPEYARFFVQSFLEDSGAATKGSALGALKEQIGTVQQIGNPLVETVLTDVALIRLAHRNSTARVLVDFMESVFPDEIEAAKKGPGGQIAETTEKGRATVRYMVDGKQRGAHMPKEVAQSLESHLEESFLYQAWMRFAQTPIRTFFVERNLGWALWNVDRDVTTFWKQVVRGNPVSSAVTTLAYLAKAAPHAWNAVAGKNSEVVQEMLGRRMLVQPGERVYRAAEISEETALNELLQHFHLFGGQQHQAASRMEKWGRFLDRYTPFSKKPGEFSERWTKIAGFMYLKDHQQELGISDQELAHRVRTRVGTPDVFRRGKWFRLYNSLLLFSNVNKEGWRAAVETAKERPFEYVTKTLTPIVGMKMIGLVASYLLFGDDWEEWWEKVPDHDRRTYGIIPMGETTDGKAVYARVPFDYTGQVVNAVVHTAFEKKKAGEKKDDLGRLFVESFPFSWAGFHPYVEVGLATGRYALEGKNPYDSFTGRSVIPDRVFEANKYGGDALTAYSRWMWNQLGGRLLVQWDTEELDRELGPLEGALHWPVIGPFLGRIYKVSSYGLEEKAWRVLNEERSEKTSTSLARERFILQAIDHDPQTSVRDLHRTMRDLGIAYKREADLRTRVEELRQRHLTNDPLKKIATFAQSDEARERILSLAESDDGEEEESEP